MNETKQFEGHTPAPLKVFTANFTRLFAGSKAEVMTMTGTDGGPQGLAQFYRVEDAKLYAAAPELLKERDELKLRLSALQASSDKDVQRMADLATSSIKENERLRSVMATVRGTLLTNGLNTHHMKRHYKAMGDVLNGRETDYESLSAELLEALKETETDLRTWDGSPEAMEIILANLKFDIAKAEGREHAN